MPKTTPPTTFAFRLRAIREDEGLSVAELAERVGISRQFIWLMEIGKCQPSFATACRLADALGVGVETLRGGR